MTDQPEPRYTKVVAQAHGARFVFQDVSLTDVNRRMGIIGRHTAYGRELGLMHPGSYWLNIEGKDLTR